MATLTTANSSFSLVIVGLYNSPQTIEGYAADDAFTAEAIDVAELVMGVDGTLSAGFVFNPIPQTITIMPTSPSYQIFENWYMTELAAKDKYVGQASIRIPGISTKYTLSNGYLTKMQPHPSAKKTLKELPYTITWERVTSEAM